MTGAEISALLEHRCGLSIPPPLAEQLRRYLELLLRWNERTNLTAVRDPEQIVLRHFGESIQCSRALPADTRTLLDFGSGAGFPGAVCALHRPELAVTLAESQGKKAAFLQELCRVLRVSAIVFAGRVEALPYVAQFDAVTLRAVDDMGSAAAVAAGRVAPNGRLVLMTTKAALQGASSSLNGLAWDDILTLCGSREGIIAFGRHSAS